MQLLTASETIEFKSSIAKLDQCTLRLRSGAFWSRLLSGVETNEEFCNFLQNFTILFPGCYIVVYSLTHKVMNTLNNLFHVEATWNN